MARRKPKTELRQRSESAWEKSYQAYLTKREQLKSEGVAVENKMSRSLFRETYTQNYEKHHKSIIRDIAKGDVLISGKQAQVYSKGFKESRIMEWMSKARSEGTIISEDTERNLLALSKFSKKGFRSSAFVAKYKELYPFTREYNKQGRNLFTELIDGSPIPPEE